MDASPYDKACALASNRPRLKRAAGSADWLWCAALREKLWNLAPQLLALCLTIVSLGLTQGAWHFQPHVPTGLNVASFVVGLACGVLFVPERIWAFSLGPRVSFCTLLPNQKLVSTDVQVRKLSDEAVVTVWGQEVIKLFSHRIAYFVLTSTKYFSSFKTVQNSQVEQQGSYHLVKSRLQILIAESVPPRAAGCTVLNFGPCHWESFWDRSQRHTCTYRDSTSHG